MLTFIERALGITPDPRATHLALVGSPLKVIGILTLYILFVKKWGPSLMKNRNGLELKGPLIIYNILQVAYNIHIVYRSTSLIVNHRESYGRCIQVDSSHHEAVIEVIDVCHGYCMLKFVDLLDTVFIVLRKRYNQLTFLHLFHHISVSLVSLMIFQYVPNGHLNLAGYLNSSVHVVMYFYYLLCIVRPNMKNSMWWKKYITLLQILQFVLMFVYILYPLMNGEQCGYPFNAMIIIEFETFIILALFINFYINTYVRKTKPKIK